MQQRIYRFQDPNAMKQAVKDFGLFMGTEIYESWEMSKMTNYAVLPASGGWLDQPYWVRRDFATLEWVYTYYEDLAKREGKKD